MPAETFILFITGRNSQAVADVERLKRVCAERFGRQIEIEIIDVLENQDHAHKEKVLFTPTLVKVHPPPERRIFGDLSDTERLLVEFGIQRGD